MQELYAFAQALAARPAEGCSANTRVAAATSHLIERFSPPPQTISVRRWGEACQPTLLGEL
jgi:hypothetical protein